MKTIHLAALTLALTSIASAAPSKPAAPPQNWFNTLIAHWTDYGDPKYLDFVKQARPEVAQVGFYGVTFYSLGHTPFIKGYPANMPVEGLEQGGQFFQTLNQGIHARGTKVVGHFNMTFIFGEPTKNAGFFKWYNDLWDVAKLEHKPAKDPVDMLQKDIDGKPISTNSYSIGGWPEYHGCLNNPAWRACLKVMVKQAVNRGVDGLIANYFYRHDCMCSYCQDGFRAYLREHYTDAQLRDTMGITDLAHYKFKEIPSWHDPAKTTPYKMAALTWTQISLKHAFDDVLTNYGRSLKPGLMVAQWNHLGDFGQIAGDERCALPGDLWGRDEDYLWYSTGGAACQTDLKHDLLGDGTLQLRYIRGAFGNKPYLLGKYEQTRIRAAIAEGVANGGAGMGFYAPFKDPVGWYDFVSYFGFLRRNRELYRDASPAGELLLLYPRSAVHVGDIAPVDRFRVLGKRLLRDHYAFDVLPDDLLTAQRLQPYRAVAYCDETALSPAAQDALKMFAGSKVSMTTADLPADAADWSHAKLAAITKAEGSPTVEVSLMALPQRLLVHLVNYNRIEPVPPAPPTGTGPQDEQPVACENTVVHLQVPAGKHVKSVRCISPDDGTASVVLLATQEQNVVTFTVPRVLVYTVAVVELG